MSIFELLIWSVFALRLTYNVCLSFKINIMSICHETLPTLLDEWLIWSCVRRTSNPFNSRSIVRSPLLVQCCRFIVQQFCICCTTNAPGLKTFRKLKIYNISLHNARLMALQIVCAFVRAFFFMRTYIKEIANFFARTTCSSHPLVQQLWPIKTH